MDTQPSLQEISEEPSLNQKLYRKLYFIGILFLVVHSLILLALIALFRPSLEPIVLRYNVYLGVDILSAWWQVYSLPLLSAFFVSVNMLLTRYFLKREQRLLAILFLLGSGVITVGLVIGVFAIVLINY